MNLKTFLQPVAFSSPIVTLCNKFSMPIFVFFCLFINNPVLIVDRLLRCLNAKRVFWQRQWPTGAHIEFDGIPFFIIGFSTLLCHHSRDHHKKKSENPSDLVCYVDLYLIFNRSPISHPQC